MASVSTFSGLASGVQWQDMVDQIMALEASRRVTPLETRVKTQEARVDAWTKYQSLVGKLKTASTALKDGSAFGAFKTDVTTGPSGRALASATASSKAAAGNYELEVLELASAEKVSAAAVTDAGAARNLSGQVFINGRAVDIASGDSLSAIRDKINAVNSGTRASGVTATILSTSASSHRLILTASQTGARGIEMVDSATSGGVLESLGVVTGARTANTSPTDSGMAQSQRFSDTTTKLASLLGVSPQPSVTTISIDGKKVTVDLANDTLITLMNKIAAEGVAVANVEEAVGGKTNYRLEVQGAVIADPTASDPATSQRLVELLGFEKAGVADPVAAGKDAKFLVDGFKMTRRSNTVTDVIGGVTINLLASDAAQKTARITGSSDLTVEGAPNAIENGSYAVNLTTALDGGGIEQIIGVTVGGIAADWDAATQTVSGRAGTELEGLALKYSGPATAGAAGNLVVEGDVAVDLKITRDTAATVDKVKAFASAYSELREFVKAQRASGGVLATNGTLRSSMNSITEQLLEEVDGISGAFTRTAQVGVALTKDGKLDVDSAELTELLETSAADVEMFFEKFGANLYDAANRIDRSGDGTVAGQIESLNVSIERLNSRVLREEDRMEHRREQLVKQFLAMETAMSSLQSQSNSLLSQLSALQ